VLDALRLTLSIFTVLPAGRVSRDPATTRRAILLAPLAGALIGAAGAGVLALVRLAPSAGGLLPAALAVTATVILTRALHLDGLADTADAMGILGDPDQARRVMRSPEVGAFGAAAIALVLVVDVTAIAQATAAHDATLGLVLGGVVGRLSVIVACRRGVQAAEGSRLGAWVAQKLRPIESLICTLVVATVVAAGYAAAESHRAGAAGQVGVAWAAGLLTGELVRRIGSRRVEGLTGDVLGACVETSTAATYVAIALSGSLVR
jgi:adenosylcobinamide-GDP ribazoletransferase